MVEWQTRANDGVEESKTVINGYQVVVDDHEHVSIEIIAPNGIIPESKTTLYGRRNMDDGRRVAEAIARALP